MVHGSWFMVSWFMVSWFMVSWFMVSWFMVSLFHGFMMMVDSLIASSLVGRENSWFGGI